ncbi:malate dehydrogenase, cytoplasmic [Onthophagus taurus]|uniref:malate dehydrogenase, cytoplasmic n=1 Tax=Onthophagus taurus TaxID=166361 RepID=UPI000C20323E|nr:malate dehydrogenase, cytoplasmic [Onthophagus taurus]
MAEPIKVVVTGAAGQIAYSLLFMIGKGDVFGTDQPLILHLLDIPPMMGVLEAVHMELRDSALPLLRDVIITADPNVAFKDVSAAFLVGAMPRKQGMERKDLLRSNVSIFKTQGQAIDQYAKKDIKVLVVGNPANTNALICAKYAPSIPKENFTAMTRLDQNRAQAQVAAKLGVAVNEVYNVAVWGNHSSTQYPDISFAKIKQDGEEKDVLGLIQDDEWVRKEFLPTVQNRGAAIIAARKLSSAMSAAKAAADHMKDWWSGTPEGKFVNMGVISDGSYGAPNNVIFSFPLTIKDKKWSIVQGLVFDAFGKDKFDLTSKELVEERDEAMSIIEDADA